tara:strand:+ start:121 stop:378 length:258 start_codon:yes stop_codon:yes gene_type:complete
MNIIIRKFWDTAQRNVWIFQEAGTGEIVNGKGEISLSGGGWSSRKEAQIVARQHLRSGKFASVKYEYWGKDSDGNKGTQLKELTP